MAPDAGSQRIPSLDGLRGIAALVVVIHHCCLVSPALSDPYLNPHGESVGTISWWITYTPLHLFWAGTEAVLIFFVLSGFVLALPATVGRAMPLLRYYPQRLLRLYLPLAAAAVFAYVIARAVPRTSRSGISGWLALHPAHVRWTDIVRDASVVRGTETLNTSLWSLHWEVLFSLALPLYVLVLVTHRRWAVAKAVLLLAVIATGPLITSLASHAGIDLAGWTLYMPIFGIGVLMARHRAWMTDVGARFDAAPVALRSGTVAVFLVLMFGFWFAAAVPVHSPTALATLRAVQVVAAGMLVLFFATTRAGVATGTAGPVEWLGKRSFSLYLVHEPIVVATAFAFGGTTNVALVLVVALPLSLVACDLFFRVVEAPAHRLSQRVGRSIASRRTSRSIADGERRAEVVRSSL